MSFAVLDRLAKEARRDQTLADGLWATGNFDCRLLACKVADPAVMTEAALDTWLDDIDAYSLVDVFVAGIAALVPGVRERADRWAASDRDWTAQAGGTCMGSSRSRTRPSMTPSSSGCSRGSRRASGEPATAHGTA